MAYNPDKFNRQVTVTKGRAMPPVLQAAQVRNSTSNPMDHGASVAKQRQISNTTAQNSHKGPMQNKLINAARRRMASRGQNPGNPTMAGMDG